MKPLILSSASRWLAFSLVSALPSLGSAADLVLQKAPPLTVKEAPAYPENLARYHFGADVKAAPHSVPLAKLQLSSNGEDQNTSETALLCDDPTTGYRLPAGASSLLISLSRIENVESVAFLNEGAEGDFAISVSNADVPVNSPEWRSVGHGSMSLRAIAANIGPGEAKYVKVNFNLSHPGRIAAFGVYATPALSDFTMPRPRKVSFEENSPSFALINFNFSDLHSRARGLYASSGDLEQISNMIDNRATTSYRFAAGDAAPTAVIDLGRERDLSRICALYAAQPGMIEFYVLRTLPDDKASEESQVQQISDRGQTGDLPASLRVSEKTLAGLKPVGSVVSGGEGRAAVDFPQVTGRYIMLKWHPASAQNQAFSVAQVAAFGRPKNNGTAQAGEGEAMNDGKDRLDKNVVDAKESPKEGPNEAQAPSEGPPPALPPVPPFTFIPEVPPTSP
ncbi:MAG: hypothetical protein ACREIF_12245 [Chthoniobacterales bacterium]